MNMRNFAMFGIAAAMALAACYEPVRTSDDIAREQQEKILQEGNAQAGMPAINNFFEKKNLKMILELRDQSDYVTYTYLYSDMTSKLTFFCDSIGYGIPYATQYTNPQKLERRTSGGAYVYGTIPQADPNGLFSPASADGTWVLCKDPNGKDVKPVYVEPRIVTSPFKLNTDDPSASVKK